MGEWGGSVNGFFCGVYVEFVVFLFFDALVYADWGIVKFAVCFVLVVPPEYDSLMNHVFSQ